VPLRNFRTALAFTVFNFAEQISIIAHRSAREAIQNKDSFIELIWTLHAIDEGRHLRFDALLLKKTALSPAVDVLRRCLAFPMCICASVLLHLNELWAARQLGLRIHLWHLPSLVRGAHAPFKKRAFALIGKILKGDN
jgi:hypothetical protein